MLNDRYETSVVDVTFRAMEFTSGSRDSLLVDRSDDFEAQTAYRVDLLLAVYCYASR